MATRSISITVIFVPAGSGLLVAATGIAGSALAAQFVLLPIVLLVAGLLVFANMGVCASAFSEGMGWGSTHSACPQFLASCPYAPRGNLVYDYCRRPCGCPAFLSL